MLTPSPSLATAGLAWSTLLSSSCYKFDNDQPRNGQNLDATVNKSNDWATDNRVLPMDDVKKYRRPPKASSIVSKAISLGGSAER